MLKSDSAYFSVVGDVSVLEAKRAEEKIVEGFSSDRAGRNTEKGTEVSDMRGGEGIL